LNTSWHDAAIFVLETLLCINGWNFRTMTKALADRVVGLKPSATVEMTERVRLARTSGRKIIGLSSGDPNIDTDPRIIEAAERAMREGNTRYGPPAGLETLREAIVAREAKRSGAAFEPADVIVTPR
jgi:aspartate aminotransferase